MIVIDANPASFQHVWLKELWSCTPHAAEEAGPEEHIPGCSSFPSENCSFLNFCASTWSFWYYSLHCCEENIFQHRVWGDWHSESAISWKEGNSVWCSVSCGKKGDLPAYLWEEVGAVGSPGWLEESVEETIARVPACSSRQQQRRGGCGCKMKVQHGENWGWRGVGVEWTLTMRLLRVWSHLPSAPLFCAHKPRPLVWREGSFHPDRTRQQHLIWGKTDTHPTLRPCTEKSSWVSMDNFQSRLCRALWTI